MIRLKPITWDNFQEVLNITIHDAQKPFVKTIPTFLAQSYVNLTSGYLERSLAVYDEKVLIGYVKLVHVPKEEVVYRMPMDSMMIDALIIDKNFQGKGYGKPVMDAIVDTVQGIPDYSTDYLSLAIYKSNKRATRLAERYGFEYLKATPNKSPYFIYIKPVR